VWAKGPTKETSRAAEGEPRRTCSAVQSSSRNRAILTKSTVSKAAEESNKVEITVFSRFDYPIR
jgi:hypothetical protein